MDHSIIILIFFAITHNVLSVEVTSTMTTDVNSRTITTVSTNNNAKIGICDICQCTVDTINCTGRQLGHHFENATWPDSPLKLVTFEDNSIVHLKPFPNVIINTLILRNNRIAKIDDRVFKEIRNLTELDLSHNHLTSDILQPEIFQGVFEPTEWQPLPMLRGLNLGHNNLHTLKQDIFAHIPDLEVLILSGNPLDVIDHSTVLALSNLYYLRELCLEYCNLKELPDYLLHPHKTSLKKLYLNGNRFTEIPIALEDAKALELLNLDDNPFQMLDHSGAFPKLPALKHLSLCSLPHLTRIGRGVFSHLTALENLSICDCGRLHDINEDALVLHEIHGAIWPPLRTLDISNNGLHYLPANLVGRWDKLTKLDLTGNEWTCDCENQYLIGNLLPNLGDSLMGEDIGKLFCTAPPEHAGKNLTSLENKHLRCLDRYGARPERDAAILVGLLIGLLLAIPVALVLFLMWRRGFIFCGSQSPASFSRAFYKRASGDDDI